MWCILIVLLLTLRQVIMHSFLKWNFFIIFLYRKLMVPIITRYFSVVKKKRKIKNSRRVIRKVPQKIKNQGVIIWQRRGSYQLVCQYNYTRYGVSTCLKYFDLNTSIFWLGSKSSQKKWTTTKKDKTFSILQNSCWVPISASNHWYADWLKNNTGNSCIPSPQL